MDHGDELPDPSQSPQQIIMQAAAHGLEPFEVFATCLFALPDTMGMDATIASPPNLWSRAPPEGCLQQKAAPQTSY